MKKLAYILPFIIASTAWASSSNISVAADEVIKELKRNSTNDNVLISLYLII